MLVDKTEILKAAEAKTVACPAPAKKADAKKAAAKPTVKKTAGKAAGKA